MTTGAPVFGVLATTETADTGRLTAAIEAAGGRSRTIDPDDLRGGGLGRAATGEGTGIRRSEGGELDAVLAVGHADVSELAECDADVPLLPVDAEPGVPSVAVEDLEAAVRTIVAGDARTEPAPLLDVAVDGERIATAYREATLITAEPAHILEYAIDHGRVGAIDVVRADGVVIATPAGSRGYAAAGEGPLLSPGTGLAIVPVAPFRTDRDRWVVSLDRVAVRVRRDEAAVIVEADGEEIATVGRDAEVSLTPAGKLGVLVVDASDHDRR